MNILYKPSFIRQLKKLEPALQSEALTKIDLFKNRRNHNYLEVHKNKGKLLGCSSFSVNYKYRIVFEYSSKSVVVLLTIGDHDVYKF